MPLVRQSVMCYAGTDAGCEAQDGVKVRSELNSTISKRTAFVIIQCVALDAAISVTRGECFRSEC